MQQLSQLAKTLIRMKPEDLNSSMASLTYSNMSKIKDILLYHECF